MTSLTIKSHKVQLTGNLITGDTYPIKQWIKTYLNGKWDADRKGWIVDLGQVEMWSTGKYPAIRADVANDVANDATSANASNWYTNTRTGRELAEDC